MDQSVAPLIDALFAADRRPLRGFGAPGHHRGSAAPAELRKLLGTGVFEADLIPLKGLDDRTESGHVVQRAHEIAAEAWQADFCRFVTGGSTQSLQIALAAVARPGDTVLLAANVHKAERSYALVAGINVVIVPVIIDDGWDVEHGVDPLALEQALDAHPNAKAFVLVSPTYYGVTSDVAALADLCHARGVPLICDAAWGGAFAFCETLPHDPLTKGADVAVYSLHKTMGALAQGSALLAKGDRVDQQRLWMAFELLGTTSPSVPILATLDATRREHALHGERLWAAAIERAQALRDSVAAIDGLRVLADADLPPGAQLDPTKVLVDVSALGVAGYAADDWLIAQHKVSAGSSDARHLLFCITPGTTGADIRAAARGLKALAKGLARGTVELPVGPPVPGVGSLSVTQAMDGAAALFGPAELVPWAAAAGRIAAETIAPAPPGVPRLVPGQRIEAEHVAWLTANRDAGAFVLDPIDPNGGKVRVVA